MTVDIRDDELPVFDVGDWTARTRYGMVWRLFKDDTKQHDPSLYDEAVNVVKEIIETGKPPNGGWR